MPEIDLTGADPMGDKEALPRSEFRAAKPGFK
jgi:hypothetical protein